MENQENAGSVGQSTEWKDVYQQEKGLSLSQRKFHQLEKLRDIVTSLHTHFGPALIAATKKNRNEHLNDEESRQLEAISEKEELIDRVKGLSARFNQDFYKVLESLSGVQFSKKAENPVVNSETPDEEPGGIQVEDESGKTFKVPKGFNKWDLKLIKLHESRPAEGKRLWVEFFSLKGRKGVGEILYNQTKDLFYFKPYDQAVSSFAMTEEQGRKATQQARNYYYRVAPNPPVEEEKIA